MVNLKYQKINIVKSPTKGTSGSAGIDVYVPEDFKTVNLGSGDNILIPTGLRFNIPQGYYLEVKNRSSMAHKYQLLVGACIIDSDYQGEVFVDIHNTGKFTKSINAGDKIAQLILNKLPDYTLQEVDINDNLYNEVSERGEGALGSTNKKDK